MPIFAGPSRSYPLIGYAVAGQQGALFQTIGGGWSNIEDLDTSCVGWTDALATQGVDPVDNPTKP